MNLFSKKITESEQSLITLQESFNELNETYSKLQESFKEISELSNTYKEEFERVDLENKELKDKIETLETEVVEVTKDTLELDALASEKAVEILSQVGHPQIDVIEEELPEMDILETFKSLKGKALQDFYNDPSNNKAIKDALKRK